MRSLLRSLSFGLAATLAGAAMAQQPFTLVIDGVVTNCYPGQTVNVQTIQGTQPVWNFDVPVDPNTCTWSATLAIASNPAWYMVSTLCNGMVVSMSDSTGFGSGDSTIVSVTLSCGAFDDIDCNGVLNGPDMPGTPCDDGNPLTAGDVWTPACVCIGADSSNTVDCLGDLGGSALPGTFCVWNNQPGTWSADCVCNPDSGQVYDCLGVLNGQNLPGTFCINFFGDSGVWSMDCVCEVNSNTDDCLGNPGGGALPGTTCVYTPDNGNTWVTGIWSPDCICGPDSGGFFNDCLGIVNGPNMPGTACTVPGTILEGTWSSACVCEPNNTDPCEADFWVIQAMGPDSLPIPYELWVWNLSSGGSQLSYSWDFGDGTSSTEAFPTHTYSGNGPYVLCLTVADNNNCSDTYCDSISINADGVYEGMVVHADDRQDGFTINVQAGQSTAVQEVVTASNIATWPNPAVDELNVAVVSEMNGLVTVTITDLDGRTVKTERTSLGGGRSQLRIATSGLNAGMYLLRISDGSMNVSQRFVKTN